MELAHPVVPSASPLTGDLDHLHRLVEAGASAVVLPSLFEEQVEHEAMAVHFGIEFGAGAYAEATGGYLPELDTYNTGPDRYLELVAAARRELPVPVIASLNGTTRGGWTLYAKILADSGVDALELNIYQVAADPEVDSAEIESRYLELVSAVRRSIDIPLAVKVGPFFSAMANMARRLVDAGADGLVLFNRFYQPDIHLESLRVVPDLVLSSPDELRLAILYGKVDCSLAATTGVHQPEQAIKLVLAGADVTMMASALLRHGAGRLTSVRDGLAAWLEDHEYQSLGQAKGSLSQRAVPDPTAFERSNYMKALIGFSSPW
jgi:dihydroorotate dehydrogenase (fumarate)